MSQVIDEICEINVGTLSVFIERETSNEIVEDL